MVNDYLCPPLVEHPYFQATLILASRTACHAIHCCTNSIIEQLTLHLITAMLAIILHINLTLIFLLHGFVSTLMVPCVESRS